MKCAYSQLILYFIPVLLQGSAKPELCRENLLLNELIREYLTFNDYKYTSSVLLTGTAEIIIIINPRHTCAGRNIVLTLNFCVCIYIAFIQCMQSLDNLRSH